MRLSSRVWARFLGGLVSLISLVACAPDGPDSYSAPVDDAVVTTERVLPSTTLSPPPPELPNMPDAETAPVDPATNIIVDVDLDAMVVPDMPA